MHTAEIETHIAEYASGKPYKLVPQPNGKNAAVATTQPPADIAVLVGELLYQARSTLDHLFFELVKLNKRNIVLPVGWEKKSEFPLNVSPPSGTTAPVPRNKFRSDARDWISDRAFTFIERVQPYNGWEVPRMLFLLTKLSNIDKHRRLSTTVVRFDFKEVATTVEGYQSTSISPNLHDGAELPAAYHPSDVLDRAVKMERQVIPRIAFDEPELGYPKPEPYAFNLVVHELPNMLFNFIVPAFDALYDET